MAKKRMADTGGRDVGPDAIHRGKSGACPACFGFGYKRKANKEGEPNKAFEYEIDAAGRKMKIRCDACGATGLVAQLPHVDYENLIDDALVFAPDNRTARVARRVDNLTRLLNSGAIDKRIYDAACDFEADFHRAGLVGLRASDPERVGGNSKGVDHSALYYNQARRRVRDAVMAMGGYNTVLTSTAWDLIGRGMNMSAVLKELGLARSVLHYDRLRSQLITALGHIAEVYRPQKKI